MSREIKFRAYHKERKEMYPVYSHGGGFVYEDTLNGVGNAGCPDYAEEVELMQFTGLKDKNGKEIYEGDIIQLDLGPEDGFDYVVVSFSDGQFIAGIRPLEPLKIVLDYWQHYPQVVGNIYENQELLQ